MAAWDVAFHQPWMHNATIFGEECDSGVFFDWLGQIVLLVDTPLGVDSNGLLVSRSLQQDRRT